ncbi:class I SAM-dependent methyltransferase [Chitinophaga vietnamensis]|uniref:class I SAM-dependent methyltransferase n=1 Tax=Chitinophaga vietnamensis TaxID=2593957 RepID=UPI00191C10A1|nr:class I SAM-dependent methyltransferase [Chitinophaga vietnamensis]
MFSEFKTVFSSVKGSDDFYRFLQVVYHLYPEDKFHLLLRDTTAQLDNDAAIYQQVQQKLKDIKPFLSELTFALPALRKQKAEMTRQTMQLLGSQTSINGYLEIGSTGRYYSRLKKNCQISGPVYLINDTAPDNSPADIMERGQLFKTGQYLPLNDYAPLTATDIWNNSVDLVTCYIGLHHAPVEKIDGFVQTVADKLRPGGVFIIRDHDVTSPDMDAFCALVHTVFNLGTQVPWEVNVREYRRFQPIEKWSEYVCGFGFEDSGERLLQQNDPSLNTLIKLVKQ